jgi:hypothetical protein
MTDCLTLLREHGLDALSLKNFPARTVRLKMKLAKLSLDHPAISPIPLPSLRFLNV